MKMKKYRLANTEYRKCINMKDYKTEIKNAIKSVNPNLKVKVVEDGYLIDANVTRKEVISIGKILASTQLEMFKKERPVLFRADPEKKIRTLI